MKKVLLVAPVLSRSGYGEMARFAFRSLISDSSIDLYIHNINWGKSGWIWTDDDERKMIDSILQKTMLYRQNGGQFDASIQCTIPNEWAKITPHDIGYTAGIETDRVAPIWLQKGNEMDKIVTISKHSADVYKATSYDATDTSTNTPIKGYKCETPISHVGFPVRNTDTKEIEMNLRHDFNFICVAQMGPRKNIEAVLNSFIEEFRNEDVGIVFKIHGANDSIMDYYATKRLFDPISKRLKEEGASCSVSLLHGNLTDSQMNGLYTHPKIKSMVSLTHGEGFGLPLYEAASHGLPVIATNWSGHLDFLVNTTGKKRQNMFVPVKYELKPIPKKVEWEGVLHAGSNWAYPDSNDARKKMRDVFKNYKKWKTKATKLQKILKAKTEQDYYDEFIKALNIPDSTKVTAL